MVAACGSNESPRALLRREVGDEIQATPQLEGAEGQRVLELHVDFGTESPGQQRMGDEGSGREEARQPPARGHDVIEVDIAEPTIECRRRVPGLVGDIHFVTGSARGS
jgi:hypothetical protein